LEREPNPRGSGRAEPTGLTQIKARLETLRQALGERFDFFWGVALPHH
jgi:hypothetical protein